MAREASNNGELLSAQDRRTDVVTTALDKPSQLIPELSKRRHLEDNGRTMRQVWRRVGAEQDTDLDSSSSCCDRPPAPVGEHPLKPAARSTHSAAIITSEPYEAHTTNMEHRPEDQHQQTNPPQHRSSTRELTLPDALLNKLKATCEAKASVSLLGRIQGKHPGLKALTKWAKETLHPSLALLSLKPNKLFEVTFEQAEGRIHALKQADLMCETAAIFFSSWQPHFDSSTPQALDKLDCPVWVQIVDLCQLLREEPVLCTIGSQLGQVIAIDNSDVYKAKLFGPRIRLLVQDIDNLPQTITIPRIDGEGVAEYALEYNGLPNQCGRCRSREHQVRHCPKKELQGKKRVSRHRQNTGRREKRPVLNIKKEYRPKPHSEGVGAHPKNPEPAPGETSSGPAESPRKGKRASRETLTDDLTIHEEGMDQESPPQPPGDDAANTIVWSGSPHTAHQVGGTVHNAPPAPEPQETPRKEESASQETPADRSELTIRDEGPLRDDAANTTLTRNGSSHTVPQVVGTVSSTPPAHESQEEPTVPPQESTGNPYPRPPEKCNTEKQLANISEGPSGVLPTPFAMLTPSSQDITASPPKRTSPAGIPPGETTHPEEGRHFSRPTPPEDPGTEEAIEDVINLLPDDMNFPKLQSPGRHSPNTSTAPHPLSEKSPTPTFIWRSKPTYDEVLLTPEAPPDKNKSKVKLQESAPITRQGYRSGRLAEDFWTALGIPALPTSTRKTLRVIPFLTKDTPQRPAEYLADMKSQPPGAITQVYIA
jgi:hypothetical protein